MSTRADRATDAAGRLRLPNRRRRTPSRPRGARRVLWSRLLPVALGVLALVATFAVILLMTVRITDGQYRLVELRAQEQALEQENESLTQDLEFHQAPQNLARRAQEEGLVPAPTEQGVVDLTTGGVSGEAVPAAEGDDEVDIAIPPPIQSGSTAADEAQQEARERRDALPSSDEEAQDQLEQARDVEEGVELHGGTIPAPQQRSGGGSEAAADDQDEAAERTDGSADGNAAAPGGSGQDGAAQDDTGQDGTAQEGGDR